MKEEAVEVAANLHQLGILLQDALGFALPNSASTLSGQGAVRALSTKLLKTCIAFRGAPQKANFFRKAEGGQFRIFF